MIATYRAELVRLLRRRVVLVTAVVAVVFAVGGAAIVTAAATTTVHPGEPRAVTIGALSAASGGTDVFRVAASFAGTFLFVVFVGLMAADFSRGTMRTMVLRQPRRVALLAGKLAATLSFAAVTLAATEAMTWLAARALAPGQGIATSAWTSLDGLTGALADYGAALVWITGYAILGMAVGVLLRSVALALAVGIAWAGPVEHIVQNGWAAAPKVFPGLSLEAFVAGGTTEISAARSLATVAVYVITAAVIAAVTFARRDVTA
ncbi:MAG TPA: hypothetical protein VFJ85_03735 [Acidimicrobiales bacterium]|nr:hypothetical protein [Acidimicrobiales bacterium]